MDSGTVCQWLSLLSAWADGSGWGGVERLSFHCPVCTPSPSLIWSLSGDSYFTVHPLPLFHPASGSHYVENELFCRFAPLSGFDSAHLASAKKRKQNPSSDSDAVRHRSVMLYNLWLHARSGWQPCFSGFCRLHNRNSSGYDSPGLFFPAWYGFFPIQTLPETAVFSCSGLSAPDWVFVYRLPLSENYVPGICQSRCPHPLHLGRHLQQRLNPPALIPHPSHQRAFLNHGRNDGLWNRGLVFRPEKSFTDRRLRHPLHRRRGKRI